MTLNGNSHAIVERMVGRGEELGVEIHELKRGTKILDCGVRTEGSIEAGRLFSSVCLGGLAEVRTSKERYGKLLLPTINVETNEPGLACIGSQKAGWRIKVGDFFALGSGPARLLLDGTHQEYSEKSSVGVLAMECSKVPGDEVASYVARKCGIDEENLTVLIARTSSAAGSTQVSARMVETALFKMEHLGIDANVISASGTAPIAQILGGDSRMMGVSNDMIIYGSKVSLDVEGDFDIGAIPSKSSVEYGVPFQEIFKRTGGDFYKIDPGIFAPAEVSVKNVNTGELKVAGEINVKMIEETLERA
jgi:methenyltetrahydromethanopterin cyclohydrolase